MKMVSSKQPSWKGSEINWNYTEAHLTLQRANIEGIYHIFFFLTPPQFVAMVVFSALIRKWKF